MTYKARSSWYAWLLILWSIAVAFVLFRVGYWWLAPLGIILFVLAGIDGYIETPIKWDKL